MKYTFGPQVGIPEFSFSATIGRNRDPASMTRSHLRMKYSDKELSHIHESLGLSVPFCNVCSERLVPFQYVVETSQENTVKIVGVSLTRQFVYCYGASDHCREWAKGQGKRNSNSADFISSVMKVSRKEALEWIKNHNRSPFYRENFPSDSDYACSQKRTLDYFIDKFGSVEGQRKYESHISSANFSRSLEGYIRRYGLEQGTEKYNSYQKTKVTMTLESVRRLFPDSSEDELNRILQMRRKNVGCTAQRYIERHGEQKWKILSEKRGAAAKNRSYKKLREKLSEEEFRRYQFRQKMFAHSGKCSAWANGLINNLLQNVFPNLEVKIIMFGKKEYKIFDPSKPRSYFYDLYVEFPDGSKKIVEFNGCMYHAPPWLSEEERSNWRRLGNNASWIRSREFDLEKVALAQSQNIEVLEVWDNDRVAVIIDLIREFLTPGDIRG